MNDARQELIDRLRAYDKHNHRGKYARLCHEAADALSADASATPLAWMYDNGTENYFFQRERQDAPLNAKAGWTETPLYSCRSPAQQDEPSTPVARQEDAMSLLRRLRDWANDTIGGSWYAHDRVNPPLFDAVDAALANKRDTMDNDTGFLAYKAHAAPAAVARQEEPLATIIYRMEHWLLGFANGDAVSVEFAASLFDDLLPYLSAALSARQRDNPTEHS